MAKYIYTTNPATEEKLSSYALMDEAAVLSIIEASDTAYQAWRKSDFTLREACVHKLHDLILKNREYLARFMTTEMGKPIRQMYAEIDKCARLCLYYKEHAHQYLKPSPVVTNHLKTQVVLEPLGCVFTIMPWNFPLWQVLRFLIPNLMAGNATILRHADCVTGSALILEKLIKDAGYPDNLFRVIIIDNAMAAKVIAHPKIVGVALTGSEKAGRAVASIAGQHLKKVVLELGGSDPYLILSDADLKIAAQICVKARFNGNGQACTSPKRLIILHDVYDEFVRYVVEEAQKYSVANPLDVECKLGPLARGDLRQTLHQQVIDSVRLGAKLLLGGEIPHGIGYYYPATILADVVSGMPAYADELFGPVITLIKAKNEEEAIHIANDVRFGLGSGIFTRDIKRAEYIAKHELNTGMAAINGVVSSDPRVPFGGIKSSGFGRELSSFGIHEFVNIKTIFID